jgi:predicted DNA-binding protein (UPF0251 family)
MINFGKESLITKVVLSILGGVIFSTRFLISYGSIKDFFFTAKGVSSLNLWFFFFFLIVLFWLGFLSVWILYSFFLWSFNFFNYREGYLAKSSPNNQKLDNQVKRIAETRLEKEEKGKDSESNDDLQVEKEYTVRSKEEFLEPKENTLSKFKTQKTLLSREEFIKMIESSGLNINQVAEKLGISRQMVSYIIHGKRKMTIRISEKAKEIFSNLL